ncbi:type VI immunity family protein [Archangium violaceum]|uniref:type VI immunity family protein n=1 Tax=Archangium violaceum TaxID=83451 RepID=UPI0036DA79CF
MNITFYMRRPHQETVRAVMWALDVYLHAVGPGALGWYVDSEGDWQELDTQGWESTRRKLLHPRGAHLLLAGSPDALTGYEFTYHGEQPGETLSTHAREPMCAVAFWLPTEYLEEHGPDRVRELTLELATGLPFNSGHAGLALLFPEGALGTTESLRDECLRYPGLDIPGFSTASMSVGTRVKGVHWLNFLGQPVWGQLGGAEGLRARLHSSGTTVRELEGERGLVSLGQWPEAGDVREGLILPAYRELARVLEPWLYEERFDWGGFSRDDMRRWKRRFLD